MRVEGAIDLGERTSSDGRSLTGPSPVCAYKGPKALTSHRRTCRTMDADKRCVCKTKSRGRDAKMLWKTEEQKGKSHKVSRGLEPRLQEVAGLSESCVLTN